MFYRLLKKVIDFHDYQEMCQNESSSIQYFTVFAEKRILAYLHTGSPLNDFFPFGYQLDALLFIQFL